MAEPRVAPGAEPFLILTPVQERRAIAALAGLTGALVVTGVLIGLVLR